MNLSLKAIAIGIRDLAAFLLLIGSVAAWCAVLGG
jgi:hypothetical protein